MDFNPPGGAPVITAETLDTLPPKEISAGKPVYELKGPLLIKGNVTGKKLTVTGGGLWIDGNVDGSDICLDTSRIRTCEEQPASDVDMKQLKGLYKEAAENGVGLYIKGDVNKCQNITAPSIAIGGNVTGGSDGFVDKGDLCPPASLISALGGYLHVGGNVTGGEAQQSVADSTHGWYLPDGNPGSRLPGKNAPEDMYQRALDRLTAYDNVLIGGNVTGAGIGTESGSIMIRGEKSGWVVLNNQGKISLASSPTSDKATGLGAG